MSYKFIAFIALLGSLTNSFSETLDNKTTIKVITLAPHLTELVYSAGGARNLEGVSAYSDYPEDAKNKQVIGDAFHLNLELIKQINPNVIFYWENSTPKQTIDQLVNMQFKLVGIDISSLNDIPRAINQIAGILNTEPEMQTNAFLSKLKLLNSNNKYKKTALIQISDQPIYTVNGKHWMSEAIEICGLNNIYDDLKPQSAAITLESLVLKSPDVIVRIAEFDENNRLNKWPSIPAIKNNHIVTLNADHFTRPTLRTLLAIESMCKQVAHFNHPS